MMVAGAMSAAPEVRGTWLTTTANEAISSPANTAASMKRLREMGLNTVYVECWKDGHTEFPSKVMEREIGIPMRVSPSPSGAIQRDLLAETSIEAHRNQLIHIAWFEYGFMAAHAGSRNKLRARKDWLSLDQKGGEVAKNGFVWMNPLHPDAQNLLLGIVKEAIRNYDLDGIQLDDRIVWPYIDMGYDDYTKNLYAKENGGQMPPENPRDPKWVAWRMAKVEAFSKRFVKEIREVAGPDFIISLSPGPHPWARENYLIDWPSWSRWQGIPTWDEYIPQVYRFNYKSFAAEWQRQVASMGARNKDLIAGIRLSGDGPDTPKGETALHAQLPRTTQSAGHCWWYSKAVLGTHAKEITDFYDVAEQGHAPHPRFGAHWRPAPVVAKQDSKGKWTARLPKGKWRAISKTDGRWRVFLNLKLDRAETVSLSHSAEAVEFLVDRRR
jgi:uncharacterized lipoprotein YddW (UPF0748 family)